MSVADLAVLVVPLAGEDDSEEPVLVTKGVLRVASRFGREPVDRKNRLTDGRLSVARMVGGATNFRRAHLGLIELATPSVGRWIPSVPSARSRIGAQARSPTSNALGSCSSTAEVRPRRTRPCLQIVQAQRACQLRRLFAKDDNDRTQSLIMPRLQGSRPESKARRGGGLARRRLNLLDDAPAGSHATLWSYGRYRPPVGTGR